MREAGRLGVCLTSDKSVLSWRMDEQSTKGTRVTKVAMNWNVIYRQRNEDIRKVKRGKSKHTTKKVIWQSTCGKKTWWPTMHLLKSLGSTPGRALMRRGNMWVGPSGKRRPPETRLRATPIIQLKVAVSWWGSVRVSRAGYVLTHREKT